MFQPAYKVVVSGSEEAPALDDSQTTAANAIIVAPVSHLMHTPII